MHQSVYSDSYPHRDEGRAHLDRLFSGLLNSATTASDPRGAVGNEQAYVARHAPYSPSTAHAHFPKASDEQYYSAPQALPVGIAHGFTYMHGARHHASHAYDRSNDDLAGLPASRVSPDASGHWRAVASAEHDCNGSAWDNAAMRGNASALQREASHLNLQGFQDPAPVHLPPLAPFQHVNNAVWQPSILPPMHLGMPSAYPTVYDHQEHPAAAAHPQWPGYGAEEEARQYAERAQLDQPHVSAMYDDDDGHPSYRRPPHGQQAANVDYTSHYQPHHEPAIAAATCGDAYGYRTVPAAGVTEPAAEYAQQAQEVVEEAQVIDPGASAIPPPPAIEDSAHPLAALATDLVWEAFLAAANKTSGPTSPSPVPAADKGCRFDEIPASAVTTFPSLARQSKSPILRTSDRSRSASAAPEGTHGNSFGAIGGERRPRHSPSKQQAARSARDTSSSPLSSGPGTPNSVGPTGAHWIVSSSELSSGRMANGDVESWTRRSQALSPVVGKQQQQNRNRGSSAQQVQSLHPSFSLAPPRALFEQVQKLLGATLLSQQVLLLALYFIAKLPQTSPLYPPATSQSALKSTSAPFKLLLAALVVANKHLDDNSFRNSTFATVSGITLPEVNALEYSLLAGLSFDINVETDTWLAWLQDLEHQETTRFTRDHVAASTIITPIINKVILERRAFLAHQQEQQQYPQQELLSYSSSSSSTSSTSKRASLDMPMTPLSPRSESSWSSVFEMDAAVPIEQRPKYKKAFSHQPETSLTNSTNNNRPAFFSSSTTATGTSAHPRRDAYGAEYRRGCSDWPAPMYGSGHSRNNMVAA